MQVIYGKGFEVEPLVSMRDKVEALQHDLCKLPQFEPPTEHVFHGGMYCRQVWRPAGCLIIGKVHKKEHFYMIVSGTVTVTTDDGVQTLTGPILLCSKPGTKRAVYANTDAMCMTIHRVDSNNLQSVESDLVEDDPNSMFTVENKIKHQEIGVTL